MHQVGCDKEEIKDIIYDINNRIEELSKKVKDTVIFVIVDHGLINVNNIDLNDYPDVIDSKLFGDGEENQIFRDALGDYLAIGITDKTLLYGGAVFLKSQYAGYNDDEIYVPLIVINCK